MKAAPSQQSSLTQYWKKAEEGKIKAQPTEIPSVEREEMPPTDSNEMDMDGRGSQPPESSRVCKIHANQVEELYSRIHAATPDPERPAKRKASTPMSADEGRFATISAISYS
jgi:hypothetical protein